MSAVQDAPPPAGTAAPVQSVDRAITILELLARDGESSVTEIAGGLGVHKSTAFRLLATLEAHRLVEQINDRGRYRLGVGNLRLAGATTARLDVVSEARPVSPAAGGRHRRDRQHHRPLRELGPLPRPGRRVLGAAVAQLGRPAHPAARHQQRQGAAQRARRRGPRGGAAGPAAVTPTRRSPRGAGCATSSPRYGALGYALAVDELEVGLTAAAAPIRSAHGDIIASMSISGPDLPARPERGSTRPCRWWSRPRSRSRTASAGDGAADRPDRGAVARLPKGTGS